ncbi:nucleoside deaminase [Planomonospora alba]|uniref:Nucleoside deaminase n=1 Tax=Planomonospora alba TaxID=161354 RepID=A0ABP6NJD9_9ACTN
MDEVDLRHLRRCVELAAEALEKGDEPFGSVLVAEDGTVLAEGHNEVASGDRTRHPEFELARWAAAHLTPAERAAATVYTSGEHCPMCAAAHAWVGLGRIVYATSSEQLSAWLAELDVPPPPVRTLPIRDVAPGVAVEGPADELAGQVRELHRRFHRGGFSPARCRSGGRPSV